VISLVVRRKGFIWKLGNRIELGFDIRFLCSSAREEGENDERKEGNVWIANETSQRQQKRKVGKMLCE